MNLGDLIQFLLVDCDLNAAGFLRNAYEGAGMLNEAGSDIRNLR